MGTPSSTMKTPKFFATFGILCIAGSINAQTGYPSPTSEPTPGTTPPGERPILIKPQQGPNPYCYNPKKCGRKFGKKGGICINMREASLVGIGKLIHKRKEAKGACGDGVYAKEDCCRFSRIGVHRHRHARPGMMEFAERACMEIPIRANKVFVKGTVYAISKVGNYWSHSVNLNWQLICKLII